MGSIDRELIERCQAGDGDAFEDLLRAHYDTIYRIAYRWCGDQSNAQDITQLVCMKLVKAIAQFRFESSFTSWLYPLVINCAKDFYKSPTQRNIREEQHDGLEVAASKNDNHERRLHAQQILQHITTLPTELRETLVLVFGSGLNHAEAAKHLDVKESTISWRIHEARKLLKQKFSSSELSVCTDEESTTARGLL